MHTIIMDTNFHGAKIFVHLVSVLTKFYKLKLIYFNTLILASSLKTAKFNTH